MNGDDAAILNAPLDFLGDGEWTIETFVDKPGGSDYSAVDIAKQQVGRQTSLTLTLSPAGGCAARLTKTRPTP